MVDNVKVKAGLRSVVFGAFAALEFILSARHYHKPRIRTGDHPVKEGHLDVGLEHYLFLAFYGAVSGVRQSLHP